MILLDELFKNWQCYRRWRGGRWVYNPMWGWMRDDATKSWPIPDVEDFR